MVIKVEGLHKKFCRNLKRSMFYGTVDIVRSMLGVSYDKGKLRDTEFWALEGIDFEVKKGETFGLVGANGSGKSTLLRMINGIYPPDKGKISVRGRIGALIAVGAGFHPHMTGRENIYLNGTILGMTKEEIEKDFQSILDFAEIGDFIDAPVSTYSSGMYVRLGFAIAIHSKPDIMLVDEILAVGDAKFQRKCLDKIKEMRNSGVTFFLVTHNMQTIEAMCSRALLMDHGKQIMIGSPKDIVPVYELLLKTGERVDFDEKDKKEENLENGRLKMVHTYPGFGTEEVRVESIVLKDSKGNTKNNFISEESMEIEAQIYSSVDIEKAKLWATFMYVNDRKSDEENLEGMGFRKDICIKKGISILRIKIKELQLTTGEYKMPFDIFDDSFTNPYFQGHFGYFKVKKEVPTMLRVGNGTPLCWANPEIEISSLN